MCLQPACGPNLLHLTPLNRGYLYLKQRKITANLQNIFDLANHAARGVTHLLNDVLSDPLHCSTGIHGGSLQLCLCR